MWNIPRKARLVEIPGLYETEKIPLAKKLIYLHFFLNACDWYVAEFDGDDTFWGYYILNGNEECEWGYTSFAGLRELKICEWVEVSCEPEESWVIRPAHEIEKIDIDPPADIFNRKF